MSSSMEFGLSNIGQVALTVKDLDRAVSFYHDMLRIPFLFRVPNMAFFDCGVTRLMLALPETEDAKPSNSLLYFKVADIDNAYSTLANRGVNFIDEPHLIAKMPDHDLWMVFSQDPDGNTLAVMSEVRPKEG